MQVFCNRKVYEFTDIATPEGVMGVLVKDYTQESQQYVGTSSILPFGNWQQVVTDKFKLGDEVRSIARDESNCFVGTIVGFELDTNTALCRSEKINNYKDKKVRYAYGVDELERYVESTEPACELEHGAYYLVNNMMLMAVRSINLSGFFNLVDNKGNKMWSEVDGKANVRHMYGRHRIYSISRM
ncbi:hypothetical protein D1872_72710 [compost metagenome]